MTPSSPVAALRGRGYQGQYEREHPRAYLLEDGCVHALMIVTILPVLLAPTVPGSERMGAAGMLAVGLLLVALAMALAPSARGSRRMVTHVVDLLLMGILMVVLCIGAVGGGMPGMPGMPAAGAPVAGFVAGHANAALIGPWSPLGLAIAFAWILCRAAMLVADRALRRWSLATGALTAVCFAVMLAA